MEEQILKILTDWLENEPMTDEIARKQIAKEITAHIMEFAEWLAYDRDRDCKIIEEVYRHWLTKIKKS